MAYAAKTYRWFSLSAGRGQDMHVRGLLSLLTGRGGVKRSDVGDIHLHHAESHVGIADTAVEGFLARLKGKSQLSEDITVTEIDSPVIPEGREKNKQDRKKSFQPGRKPRSAGKWHPDDRADRPKRSGPKKAKPWQDDTRSSRPKNPAPDRQISQRQAPEPQLRKTLPKRRQALKRPARSRQTPDARIKPCLSAKSQASLVARNALANQSRADSNRSDANHRADWPADRVLSAATKTGFSPSGSTSRRLGLTFTDHHATLGLSSVSAKPFLSTAAKEVVECRV